MDDHFQRIYANHAHEYHRMISAEDIDRHLLQEITQVTSIAGKRLVDIGSGTGRIPLLLSEYASYIVGVDRASAMLVENKDQRLQSDGKWELVQGDARTVPLCGSCADLVTAGWALGHFCGWYTDSWQEEISKALYELFRIVRPGGHILIFETLGTGTIHPSPPTPALEMYYQWLVDEWAFQRREIQTDYQFTNLEEAVLFTEFFFGAELAASIRAHQWLRLPEWTGLWYRQK